MNSWHVLTALAAIGAGAIGLRATDQHRREAEVARLRADIVSLSAAVGDARRGAAAEAARPSPPPAAERAPVRPSAPAEEEAAALAAPARVVAPRAAPPTPAEVLERFETTFTGERADPTWSPNAQAVAQRGLRSTLPETSTLRSVDCRTSMCRIETAHEDVEHYRQFVEATFANPETKLWNGAVFTSSVTAPQNGRLVVVSYLAHEGEELPQAGAPE